MTPQLSLCMIAKNEERHLPRCLASVRGLVDEIVLVDTGSTDRTVEIARSLGARVFELPWQDDFSLARNHSLESATGEWILSLDADESIAARDHSRIRAWLQRSDLDAVTSLQRHYLPSATVVGWQPGSGGYEEGTPYPGYADVTCRRLFRNRPWLRFRNRVHEELVSIDRRHPLAQLHDDWVIHHFGKADSADVQRAKAEAYLRIGILKVADDPRAPLAHYELAMQYAELQDWNGAIACFERTLTLDHGFRDARFQLAICLSRRGDHRQALDALHLAARKLPHHAAEIAVEQGLAHRLLGDNAAAEAAFRRALTLKPGLTVAWRNLALEVMARARAMLAQRQFADARDCLATLDDRGGAGDGPYVAQLAGLRGIVSLGLGRLDEAIAHLRRSVQTHPTHEAAMNLSIALEARGDRTGALASAITARDLSPNEPQATARVARLSSHSERPLAAAGRG